jgi:hypothetical protein
MGLMIVLSEAGILADNHQGRPIDRRAAKDAEAARAVEEVLPLLLPSLIDPLIQSLGEAVQFPLRQSSLPMRKGLL